ncbi:hypothetical protein DFH06DRAFT_1246243 [Mycena polygramma]|nr:hypothetical protein DFH06DRAFT_1246243 [Mycena polygramma]
MPVVAFAFGSFGDILATMQLLLKVISVLKDGQRSSERDETEKELKSLETDLANLTLLPIDETIQSSSPMAIWVAKRIQEEVQRCHLTILRFYQKCTASNGLIPKLLWAMSEEKELAAFKTRILERRTALAVVVGMLNLGALLAVKDRVEEVGQGTSRIRDVVQQSMSGLAQQQGTGQMREMVQESVNILAQQLAAYRQEIVAIHHVPRGVSEETFTVVNSTGVSIPIPLAYCRSWKVGPYLTSMNLVSHARC